MIYLQDVDGSGGREGLTGAVSWVQHLLTGSAATAVAIIAVAGLGAAMLSGRLPLRRGISVVLGCFIIFSAGFIADGIVQHDSPVVPIAPEPVTLPAYQPTTPTPLPYDPYAGASVPKRPGEPLPGVH